MISTFASQNMFIHIEWLNSLLPLLWPGCPRNLYYTLTAPAFDCMKIDTPRRTLVVEKHGESYIDRMMLDDKPLTKYRILHNELLKGGTYFWTSNWKTSIYFNQIAMQVLIFLTHRQWFFVHSDIHSWSYSFPTGARHRLPETAYGSIEDNTAERYCKACLAILKALQTSSAVSQRTLRGLSDSYCQHSNTFQQALKIGHRNIAKSLPIK